MFEYINRKLEQFIEWWARTFYEIDEPEEKKLYKTLPVPDFDDMVNWKKIEIDQHAESYGISLDRRKLKKAMISDYRAKYAEWVERMKNEG